MLRHKYKYLCLFNIGLYADTYPLADRLYLYTISVDIMHLSEFFHSLLIFCLLLFMVTNHQVKAQSTNDILNVLTDNKTITQQQADSLRATYAIGQQNTLPDKKLQIDFELRPRSEYRNGYQQLRNDSVSGAFFTNQRSRLGLNYSHNDKFILQFSLQDLRVWGQQDPRTTAASVQVFESWAELMLSGRFSVRLGRQRLIYDNQRLFAENDWRLSGAAHDALNFRFQSSKVSGDLAFAFNQMGERYFGTDYTPATFNNYKFLVINYIKYTPNKIITLTVLNSSDGFQTGDDPEKMNFRYTLGGRIEAVSGSLYGTLSGYYQGGKNSSGENLSAWYVQPEIRVTTSGGPVVRLGAEIFSGTGNLPGTSDDRSFVPLYGVAHRFNGSMDHIVRFPNDVGNAGLMNPYLFMVQSLFKKLEIRSDLHLFYLQTGYYEADDKIPGYLGMENDWLLTCRPHTSIKIDLGFSYMLPTESLEKVKGSGDSSYNLFWGFLSLTFRPVLFSTKFK